MSNNDVVTPGLDLAVATIKAYAVHNQLTAQNIYDMFNIGVTVFINTGVLAPDADCLLAHQLAQQQVLHIPKPNKS